MPALTIRLTPDQHEAVAQRAREAGLSMAAYCLRTALAEPTDGMIRDLHRKICGTHTAGAEGEEADLAVEALRTAGLTAGEARARIERAIAEAPMAGADELVRIAYTLKGR